MSSEPDAEAQTIQSQVARCAPTWRRWGWRCPPEREFLDEGYSGATLVRPALERLRDVAARRRARRALRPRPDRLARKYAYQVLLLEEFAQAGVRVVFLTRALGRARRTTCCCRCRAWSPSTSGPGSWSAAAAASATPPARAR